MDRRRFLCCVGCVAGAALHGCTPTGRGPSSGAGKAPLKPDDVACCGVDCQSCDVRRATVHGDKEALKRAQVSWEKTAQEHWGMRTLDPAILKCKGCRTEGVDIFKGCRHCPIRRCCRKRGLASCAQCAEWESCGKLKGLFADEPRARENLARIAASAKR